MRISSAASSSKPFLPRWASVVKLDSPLLTHLNAGDLLVSLESLTVHQVIGFTVSGIPVAVRKYVASDAGGPWRLWGAQLARLIDSYSPRTVAYSSSALLVDPIEGVEVPVPPPGVYAYYSSRLAALELLGDPRLPPGVAQLLGSGCVGVTGSLLLGSWIEGVSDVDLVVNGCECLVEVWDGICELGLPLTGGRLGEWAAREARARSLPVEVIAKLYRGWHRRVVGGVEVSIAAVECGRHPYPWPLECGGGVVSGVVEVEGWQCSLLYTRGVALTSSGPVDALVVYDGLYKQALWVGGLFRIRGLLCRLGELRVALLGAREFQGLLAPLN